EAYEGGQPRSVATGRGSLTDHVCSGAETYPRDYMLDCTIGSTLKCVMKNLSRIIVFLFCLASLAGGVILTSVHAQRSWEWAMGGQNLFNTRNQAAETTINTQNAASLALKWVFTTEGDVPVTPAVVDGSAYAPDWPGNLFKIDANTGQKIWSRKLSDYV